MKRKLTAIVTAISMVTALAACGGSAPASSTTAAPAETTAAAATEAPAATEAAAETEAAAAEESSEGKVFNIYAWNEEFKGFFEKYYQVPDGVTVNWIITPSDNGAYQQKLDEALLNQANAADDDKVDMFLAEADYILKYAGSEATQDITALGVSDFSNTYKYTVQAASDNNGVVKGVSFQCCPSALIYRRSIAEDVLGVSEPDEVQAKLDSWDKFNAVAKDAKDKGYYMTASFAETYRVFSNNCTMPWVDADNNLQFDPQIEAWIAQTEDFINNDYTLTAGIWDDEKNAQMFADGKTMCFFGPAWYFNFCMGNAQDPDKGCSGDWAICEGPAAHFWGGTWLMAPAGTDNPTMLADVMNTFINDEEVCSALVANEAQFSNNQKVNAKFAEDESYGNEFLGGQNDVAVFSAMTDNIVWENHTIYDQLLNEGLQNQLQQYFKGSVDKDTALKNFYNYINETYPAINTP
ncbi:MAG: carbohydrate ABC transporter substrate-binding protein [Lachnospiraceae bacterium]|nr:carbohydrate ABC transporter substrate-binding protein [Lachnospiraceae bacterium]